MKRFAHRSPGLAGEDGARAWVLVPSLWLACLVFLPSFVFLKIVLAKAALALAPFALLFDDGSDAAWLSAALEGVRLLLQDPPYASVTASALRAGAVTTVSCVLLGLPLALAVARSRPRWRGVCLGLLALVGALALGAGRWPHTYLPLMVLVLYANLEGHPPQLLEAAKDLGAGTLHRFLRITLPLALPGVVAGAMLVFALAALESALGELLGSADARLVGVVLWGEFFTARDWPVALAVSSLLTLLMLLPFVLMRRRAGAL